VLPWVDGLRVALVDVFALEILAGPLVFAFNFIGVGRFYVHAEVGEGMGTLGSPGREETC